MDLGIAKCGCFNDGIEAKLINSIAEDDNSQLISLSTSILNSKNDTSPIISKLFHLCCSLDSINCATSLLNGELGAVPPVHEFDASGMLPLHAAAEAHASRCVEMLLKKRVRTDLKTRDGRGLLPLELSLLRSRMDVIWNPDDQSIEELVVQLSEKDLTTVKLLSEKGKDVDEVAYSSAIEGRVVDLAALLIVAGHKISDLVFDQSDQSDDAHHRLNSKKKATIYEFLIREALGLGHIGCSTSAKRKWAPTEDDTADKRKLLLCQIQLLQLFGAVSFTSCTEKRVTSLLILASRAGDKAIIELLLKANIDVNDVDADGNSALHWCLKTSKKPYSQQLKILWLLVQHGAQVNKKDKLGLTAVHIAAGNGNTPALRVLLLEDPDSVNSKTETKETPLHFAVKNDSKICAELLLRWGASTEVFNLRKQRPIDLAQSQDMRFLLNPTNISLIKSSFPVRQRYTAWLQGDEVISETCEEFFTMKNTTDRTCSSTKTEICKYFESATGCVRGSKCFYAHAGAELRQMKQRRDMIHSLASWDLERKIFVGGLPPSMNSDLLRKFFEEKFGAVDEALVVGIQSGDKIQSRGFGFVTFKHKKSVSEAVGEHYVSVMGKKIEIKSAIPKCLTLSELQESPRQREEDHSDQHLEQEQTLELKNTKMIPDWLIPDENTEVDTLSGKTANENTDNEMPNYTTIEEANSKQISWADTLVCGQPKADSNKPQMRQESMPKWLKTFKKWLPDFLQQVAKREGEYALSSLKADFRIAFGLELDHASLGFSKLSDFMRTFPDLCCIKFVPIGRQKPANHMVLLPSLPNPLKIRSPSYLTLECRSTSESEDAKGFQDQAVPLVPKENDGSTDCRPKLSHQMTDENSGDTSVCDYSKFLQFLEPDLIFHGRPWLFGECDRGMGDAVQQVEKFQGLKSTPEERHLVLETLARKRNNSSEFFLREFDFYDNYKASIVQGRCFGCNQRRVLWANFPCQHQLWCANCKLEVTLAANNFEHKCVVCDIKVQKIDIVSWCEYYPTTCYKAKIDEFPPFNTNYM